MTPIHQYIYSKPKEISEVLDFLNEQILTFDPEIKSSVKWSVPYYTRRKSLCYLNVVKSGEVELNFTKGYLFSEDTKNLIKFNGRTVVGGIKYKSLDDIDVEIFVKVLKEAVSVDLA
jgi:hypothetical protein